MPHPPVVDGLVALLLCGAGNVPVVERRALSRLILRTEDPRSIALVRIVAGILLLAYVNALAPLHRYLFSDEGLFLTDAAQQVYAAEQFAGFGDGSEPG